MAEAEPETPEITSHSEPKRNILMPVDPSEHSLRAFVWYADHLHKRGDLLHLVHVVEPVCNNLSYTKATQVSAVAEDFSKLLGEHVDKGKSLGTKYHALGKERNIKVKFTLHIGSKAGEHIVKTAKEHNADIIVMGNRGVGTIRRTFLGSVSDYIIHHIHLPIILIPPTKDAKDKEKDSKSKDKKEKDSKSKDKKEKDRKDSKSNDSPKSKDSKEK